MPLAITSYLQSLRQYYSSTSSDGDVAVSMEEEGGGRGEEQPFPILLKAQVDGVQNDKKEGGGEVASLGNFVFNAYYGVLLCVPP